MKLFSFCLLTMLTFQGVTRDFVDPVGFPTTSDQAEKVIEQSLMRGETQTDQSALPQSPMYSAICPHDDHIYAGPLYLPVMKRLSARHLVLIGVFHKAWKWDVEDALIFDDFETWKGPHGSLPVDTSLRSAILEELPDGDFIVNNEYHSVEHSLEAFTGFIQHFDPEAVILPILVPYMKWERVDSLARDLSEALSKVMKKKNWKLGRDVQILISNDSVHYGDQGWGGKNYAPFGTGIDGLKKAKERDMMLIQQHLLGTIEPVKTRKLLYHLVDEEDVRQYRVTWCGRFSVPFGVNLTYHLSSDLHQPVPRGILLGYGTSVELGELPVRDLGLGVTAPANLRHWVGYTAVGYFPPEASQ
jgi:AmmeMemoRadiSam system protein B